MKIKKLSEAKIGEVCVIENVDVSDQKLNERLKNLGFIKNEKVQFLKYNYGKSSMLIKVMNVNYSIDKSLCEKIKVKYE